MPRGRITTYALRVLAHVIVYSCAVLMALPFVWCTLSAFKPSGEILKFPPTFIPSRFTLENIIEALGVLDFPRLFLNTLIYSSGVTLGCLLLDSMAAFAFSRFRFRGRELLFSLVISTMMIPFYIYMIALFVELLLIGWIDTFLGLIVPGITSAFGIFMLAQFMQTIPDDYIHAARVDGASYFAVYHKVVLPLCKDALITLGVFHFMSAWTNLLWPLIVCRSAEMFTLPVGLAHFSGLYYTYYHILIAGTFLAVLPPLVVFIVFRRKIVESMTLAGLKF